MRALVVVRGVLPHGRAAGATTLVTAVLAVLALLTACGSTGGPEDATDGSDPAAIGSVGTGSAGTGSAGTGSAGTPGAAAAPGTGGADETGAPTPVVTGLAAPWGLAFLPDGRALVSERDSGRVLLVPARGATPTEVVTLPVTHRGEGGLLGLAVSPDHATDGFVYAYYTSASDNRIVRLRLGQAGRDGSAPDQHDADRLDPGRGAGEDLTVGAVENVLTGLRSAPNHNGGRIAFGPDGNLYAAVGDAGDRQSAQDPSSPNGKILRMTPDGGVPADNPIPGSLVYSLGHRNVQGLAWDSADRLWASEFGQNTYDEINLITPGANYGWPLVEGVGDTAGGRFTNPLVTWSTDEASPSGIAIRDDTLYVAALRGERLWVLNLADGTVDGEPRALFTGELGRLRTVEPAPDGTLWLTTSNTDGRGDPHDGDDRIVALR